MADLRELLRDAAPSVPPPDLDEVWARARQRSTRRRGIAAAAAAVAIVVSAAAIAVSAGSRGEHESTRLVTRPDRLDGELRSWMLRGVRDVAVNDAGVWAAVDRGGDSTVVELDPATGRVRRTISVDGQARSIGAAGRWSWVLTDIAATIVDSHTGRRAVWVSAPSTPSSAAMVNDTVWVVAGDKIGIMAGPDATPNVTVFGVGDAHAVVAIDGMPWLQRPDGTVARVDPTTRTVVETEQWSEPLFGASATGGVWTTDGSRVVDLHPHLLSQGVSVALGTRVDAGAASAVADDGNRVFIATPDHIASYQLADGDAAAPARIEITGVNHLVARNGAAWFTVGDRIYRWTPPSPTASPASSDNSELCIQVERQARLREADITDRAAIADLVAALPPERRTDAALFYYPYGGTIPAGTDTSGLAAQAAGERLSELYASACN